MGLLPSLAVEDSPSLFWYRVKRGSTFCYIDDKAIRPETGPFVVAQPISVVRSAKVGYERVCSDGPIELVNSNSNGIEQQAPDYKTLGYSFDGMVLNINVMFLLMERYSVMLTMEQSDPKLAHLLMLNPSLSLDLLKWAMNVFVRMDLLN